MNYLKSLVKSILTRHYGVYGMLQPPCNGNFFQCMWCKLTTRLYTWSNIPKSFLYKWICSECRSITYFPFMNKYYSSFYCTICIKVVKIK